MSNIRPPEYGVEKDELTLTSQDPAAVLYGVNPNNKFIPLKVTDDGTLVVGATITLEPGDVEIGAVEIKNYNTDDRAYVSPNHEVLAQARLYDATGNALSSTSGSLDVNITNSLSLVIDESTSDILVYGQDSGLVNRAIRTNSSGQIETSVISSVLPTGAATEATLSTRASEATLSGFRTDFNAVDFSTETTLLAVKTDLDKFTFLGGSVNSNITNATLAVTQSGVWSTGRTWTLSSGTDSITIGNATLAVTQSGTWNINNISGTISLPTGAATETTLSAINSKLVTGTVIGDVNAAQKGTWNINNVSGTISLPTGAATETTLATRLADATFTGRINTLGQKTMANSTPIVIASDQSVIPASQSGIWSVRLQDGSGTALTSSLVNARQALDIHQADTSFIVSGLTAVGLTPSLNPISISGVDGSGFKRHILTDANGKTQVDLNDGAGTALTSTAVSTARALDVNAVSSPNQAAAAANQVFVTSFDFNLPSAGTEAPVLFFKNPAASGKTMIIKHIMVSGISTANNEAVIALYGNPTTSANGSAQTTNSTSLGSGATTVATVFSAPTVSVNGFRFLTWQVPSASQNTPTAQPINVDGIIRLAANNTLLITGKAAANNFNMSFSIYWQEI